MDITFGLLALVVAVIVVAVSGRTAHPVDQSAAAALALLDEVPASAGTGLDGYSRAQFHVWSDPDRNGCDARNDTLRRDLENPQARDGTHGCVIIAGTLHDPYSGQTVPFVKASADQVPIDHIVPLAQAWRHGANQWDDARRTLFGNDPNELLATTKQMNQAKGDKGPAAWLPPNPAFACQYAAAYVTVLHQWGLSATSADIAALRTTLRTCR